jgi:PAS domain S-box-containing protein
MSNRTPQTFDLTELPADVLPAAMDIDRDRAYRRQAAVAAFSRRAIAPPNVRLLIQDAAALVAETLSVERFGIAELSEDRSMLELRLGSLAAPGGAPFGDPALSDLSTGPVLDRQFSLDPSSSLAAYAMQSSEVVAVADLAADHRFADRWLLEQRVRSAVVVPLRFHDQSYGVLGAFSDWPTQFAHDDLMYAEMIANLVSTNIARDLTVKVLESERRFTSTMLETIDAIVLVLTPAGRIIRINSAGEHVTGFTGDEVRDRPIWSALLVPGETDALKDLFARLKVGDESLEHESFLLTKQAERRRIQWSFAMLAPADDDGETILATGIDITERRAAEQEVGRLQAVEVEVQQRLQTALEEIETHKSMAERAISTVAAAAFKTAASDSEADGWSGDSNPFHPLPQGPRGERRKRPRRSFAYFQRMAATHDGRIPPLRTFRRVQCLDISAGGFSFLSSVTPTDNDYVVALGNPPVVIHVAARLIHVTPTLYEGQPMYLVGCAYTGRLDY